MHLRTYLATTRRILTQLPASSGSSMTQLRPSRSLLAALEAASTVAKELSDEYISTEHLLIGLAKGDASGSTPTVARILADAGLAVVPEAPGLPAAGEWPQLIDRALLLGPPQDRRRAWQVDGAASRAAETVLGAAGHGRGGS